MKQVIPKHIVEFADELALQEVNTRPARPWSRKRREAWERNKQGAK